MLTEKMDKVGAVIKYFCKKGTSLKEIHTDFIKTLGDVSHSYGMVKKWAYELGEGGRGWRIMNSLGALKNEKGFYFEGIINWNSDGESASRQRVIILRNNGTISALGHSQSTGSENSLIIPRIYT